MFEKKRLGGCVAPRASRVPSPVNMLGITATAPRSRGFFHIYSLWLLLQIYCGYEFIYIVMLQMNQVCSKVPRGRMGWNDYLVVALERREGLSSLNWLRISHPLDCLPRWHLISNIPCVSSCCLNISLFFWKCVLCYYQRPATRPPWRRSCRGTTQIPPGGGESWTWTWWVKSKTPIDLLKAQYIECIFNYLALPFGFLSTMLDAEREVSGCTWSYSGDGHTKTLTHANCPTNNAMSFPFN